MPFSSNLIYNPIVSADKPSISVMAFPNPVKRNSRAEIQCKVKEHGFPAKYTFEWFRYNKNQGVFRVEQSVTATLLVHGDGTDSTTEFRCRVDNGVYAVNGSIILRVTGKFMPYY